MPGFSFPRIALRFHERFLRAFPRFASLIRMIEEVTFDMRYFLVIVGVALLASNFVFYLLFTRDKIADPAHDPTNVYASLSDSLFSQITLLLGDFDVGLLSPSS